MSPNIAAWILIANSVQFAAGQDQTVGLFLNDATRTSPGYILLPPIHNGHTYLIDNNGQVVNTWYSGNSEPGRMAYLLPNGHLLRSVSITGNGLQTGGGDGGRIEEYDWQGNKIWSFDYATSTYSLHHDLKQLPNGNVIALLVETKTPADMAAAGFRSDILQPGGNGNLLPDAVVEIQPKLPTGGQIVWEWHVWDHLVQNYDSSKANYGSPAAHPELIDPNASYPQKIPAFWNHMNSIDYNPDLDQIMVSVRGNSEVWVIDHSTTTAEAAGHAGGRYGKGGDLLFRWGNPSMYSSGKAPDEMLYQQHDAQWIAAGVPGAGNVLIFNNGVNRPGGQYSSVDEFVPPVDANGNYPLASSSTYGPKQLAWTYAGTGANQHMVPDIGGAQRLPNGNTLICFGTFGLLEEVTPAGDIVWKYVNPVVQAGPLMQGQTPALDPKKESMNAVFKVRKYPLDYSGLAGQDLTPKGPIELYPETSPDAPSESSQYPDLKVLPAGEFQMGDHFGYVDPAHPSDEVPLHMVWIDALYIGTYDVTNSQYVAFLNSAYSQGQIEVRGGLIYGKGGKDFYVETHDVLGYSSIGWDGAKFSVVDQRANHPVGVRWFGAAAYTNWLSRQQGYQPAYDTATWKCDFTTNGYRLPTEAEWEYAARGGQYNPYYNYPWGNDVDFTRANWPDENNPYQTGPYPWTTPVGFYNGQLHSKADFGWPGSQATYQTSDGSNAWGLYDMSGNVWQWVNDWYQNTYYSVSPSKNPAGPDASAASPMPDGSPDRGMRGGNWYNGLPDDPGHAHLSNRTPGYYRAPDDPKTPYYHVGFRVARPAGVLSVGGQ